MSTTQDIILTNWAPGIVDVKEYELVALLNDIKDILRILKDADDNSIANVKQRLYKVHEVLESLYKDIKTDILYFEVQYLLMSDETKSNQSWHLAFDHIPEEGEIIKKLRKEIVFDEDDTIVLLSVKEMSLYDIQKEWLELKIEDVK